MIFAWALCLFSILVHSATAHTVDIFPRALTLADTPPCGLSCFISVIPESGCALDDLNCQCQNVGLAQANAACLLENCTMADALGTSKVQASLCGLPNESKSNKVLQATIVVYEAAFLAVCLRIYRKYIDKRLGVDDYTIIAAILLTTLPCGLVIAMTQMGFGKHIWSLQNGQLKDNLLLFFIASTTYVIVLGMIKVSIVMFYLQIFPWRNFRILSYTLIAYIVSSNLAIFLATVFSCWPVRRFWDRDVKGTCLDISALAFANSGNAIAQDFLLIILPIIFVGKLNVSNRRKVVIGIMFAVGTLGFVATIVRLKFLLDFKVSIDPTWDYVEVTIWTTIELASGFVSVCLPAIRQLIVMAIPNRCFQYFDSVRERLVREKDDEENLVS
ncbi:hypothetical protein DM02DRAFT_675569 [Periconia macrospinosa]|uniref:CFEM domain-containing protein n=1 Tax=Periconia macrospinosa TaxID=97972 RepID=A0A2V1DB67_9PLEO|nr:hypothetical protein DM02DRAFT_675569 [Periconia macrospinosa]